VHNRGGGETAPAKSGGASIPDDHADETVDWLLRLRKCDDRGGDLESICLFSQIKLFS
jgi:hypothetical protein